MWKNIVEPQIPQVTIWRIRIACRTPNNASNIRISIEVAINGNSFTSYSSFITDTV